MLALTEITSWHWAGFVLLVLLFLVVDLGVFHRKAHVIQFKEALIWTFVWSSFAMLFAGGLSMWRTKEESLEFITGYIIELSLSMDNVFVIALIFAYFRVVLGNSRCIAHARRDDRNRRRLDPAVSLDALRLRRISGYHRN